MCQKYIYSLFFLLVLVGCSSEEDKKENEIVEIPISMKTVRFDSLFFNTPIQNFEKLKTTFPYLFPDNTPDSIWVNKQKDTLQQELYQEVQKAFSSTGSEQKQLRKLFQHIKYYFPKFKAPKVLFLTSDVDYHSRVIYSDSLLLVGLDNYLGKDHRFYQNIPEYVRFHFEKQDMIVDVAQEIASQIVPATNTQDFLSALVEEGKKEYLLSLFLPKTPEYLRLKFPEKKWEWTKANETEIWRYIIDNQLLFSTDKKLLSRFIYPAPFSKFYLELDNESPGGVGKFIGFKIVQSYMQHNEVNLQQMLSASAEEIFKKSQYKPQK